MPKPVSDTQRKKICKCKREGHGWHTLKERAVSPLHSKDLMFCGALPLFMVNTGKAKEHQVTGLEYVEGYLVISGHESPCFFFTPITREGALHVYIFMSPLSGV